MAKKAEVHIAFNGSQAQNGLKDLDRLALILEKDLEGMAQELKDIELRLGAQSKEYKALNRTIHETEQRMKAYTTATDVEVEKTKKLADVVADLANTKLRDLKRAIGQGKSMIQGLTGSDADLQRAEQIRKDMKKVMDQARLIEGEYVKISGVIGNLGNVSDKVLTKAIKQQQEDVAWIDKTDAAYQTELATLKKLQAEEEKRRAAARSNMSKTSANDVATTGTIYDSSINSMRNASLNEMKEAKNVLTNLRDNSTNKNEIEQYNKDLAQLEQRMKSVTEVTKNTTLSWKQLRQILSNQGTAPAEDIKKAMDIIQQKIAQLPSGSKRVADLRQQYAMLERSLKGVSVNAVNVNDILKRLRNGGKVSILDLKQAAKQLEEQFERMHPDNKYYTRAKKDLEELRKKIEDVTGAAKKQSSWWRTAMKNLTAYVGLFAVFNQVKQYFTDLFKLNMQFGDQLTNIRKVALFTNDEVGKLSRELTKLDTRTSLEALNQIAYAGAKLGVQTKGGTEALAGFVRAADQVNVALKEDLGEEALTALAKIAEVSGNMDKMGVEQAMLRIGSSIFRLASTSTAASGKIVDFSNRMLAVGEQASLTTPDILALGAAVDSMALAPEIAATAFSKLVVSIRKGTLDIEKDLGIVEGSLKDMVEKGEGAKAIQTIFEAMGRTGNVFALDDLFKDLGSEGQRLITTMVTMGAKHGMLERAITESNKAFREGTAVTVEYNMQQETAQAYMERAANLWEKQFVSADAASGPIRDIAKAWYEVTDSLTHSIGFMTEVRLAITLIFGSVKALMFILPTAITMLSTAGLAGAFTKLMLAINTATAAGFSFSGMMTSLYASYAKLNLVMKATVWGAAIGFIAVIIAKMAEWSVKLNEVSAGQRALNEVQEEGTRKALEEQESLKRLHNVMKDTTASMDLRLEAMNKLNDAIPNLNAQINEETGAVTENTKAWEENFKRLQDYYELEGARSKLADLGRQKVDAILDLQKKEDVYANTNVDVPTGPQTSGGAYMPSQSQGAIGQAGQKAAAKSARDDAQKVLDDIVAQEEALRKKFGARLDVDGNPVGGGKKVGGGGGGKTTLTNPDDEARNHIAQFLKEIEEYYTRQKNEAINRMTADGVEKALQDATIDDIDARMQAALQAARTAIVKENDAWTKFRDSMQSDLLEPTDENGWSRSQDLLTKFLGTDAATFGKELDVVLAKIKHSKKEGDKIIGYKPEDSDELLRARLLYQNAQGENTTAKKSQRRKEAMRKDLIEHDYTGMVQDNSFISLVSDGFANANAMSADFSKQKEDIISLLEKSRSEIVAVLASKGNKTSLMSTLFGKDWETSLATSQFAPLLNMEGKEFELFYQKLLQYSDEYTQAQKKQYDEQKKVVEMQWKLKGNDKSQTSRQQSLDKFNKLYGEQNTFASRLGFSDKAYDPEIESYKLKLQFAREYYEYIMETSTNAQLQKEAEMSMLEAQNALTVKLVEQMRERMQLVKDFAQPIVDFGSAAGEALAQFSDDVDSAQEAMRNAVKSMLKSWGEMMINNIMSQIWQGLNNGMASQVVDSISGVDTSADNLSEGDSDSQTEAAVTSETEKYSAMLDVQESYQEASLEMWKDYADQKREILGESADAVGAESPDIVNKQEQNEAELEQQKEQNAAVLSLEQAGKTALLSAGKKFFNRIFSQKKKQAKQETKLEDDKQDEIVDSAKESGQEQFSLEKSTDNAILSVSQTAATTLLNTKKQQDQEEVRQEGQKQQVKAAEHSVGMYGMCVDTLGPIAGPIAFAAMQAVLMGLLQYALSLIGGSSDTSTSSSSSPSVNTKLVSGMLTYDKGNLQQLYIGNDGRIYSAQEQTEGLSTGIVDHPIATTVNGQPSLVAENGPELVVGRETTAAMMQNAPGLLRTLLQFDKNRTLGGGMGLYDSGNVQQVLSDQSLNTDDNTAMMSMLAQLHTLLTTLNTNGVQASIGMYGRNGLYNQSEKARQFMKGRG